MVHLLIHNLTKIVNTSKNAKIRKAFSLAMDREGMVKTLYKGLAEPAVAWCPPEVKSGEVDFREKKLNMKPMTELKKENPDPKALLIEGLKEEGLDPDPSKHTIKFIQSGTSAVHKEFAEFEQQKNYKNVLGVNIEPDFCEWAVFQARTLDGDYELASQAWSGDYNDPNTFFDLWISNSGMNRTGWKNTKYDELIKQANETQNEEERVKLYTEAEKLLVYEDAAISPGVWRYKNTYVRKYVKNYSSPILE